MGRDALWEGDRSREAKLLLAHAAGIPHDRVSHMVLEDFTDKVVTQYLDLVQRRAKGEPMSHILGYRDFWKHRFKVTPDVLDPRPDTETLIEVALQAPFERVLDLGTGSGCILISLLAERPHAAGVGCDISEKAILVAGENAASVGVADRLILPLSEWFDDIGGTFDLIVSNPPYISADEMAGLGRDVHDFEPHIALTDGGDGLGAYRSIAKDAPDHLTPGGRLLVEIGPKQAGAVSALFAQAGLVNIKVHTDLDGRDRVVAAQKIA
jgi:release factor glutamine methyltransferase